MKINTFKKTICSIALAITLSGCSTLPLDTNSAKENSTATKIDKILEKVANDAYMRGDKKQSLALMENAYKKDSTNPAKALNYARILRLNNQSRKGTLVLAPFIYDPKVSNNVLTEYAYLQTSMGNYNIAEDTALKVIEKDETAFKARHALGVALDAQGHHKQAEQHFRKALEIWEGDPIPLLNNLALSLASQGYLDESVNLLQKASQAAPNRTEIERNLRIITTLQQSTNRIFAPKPIKKPSKL